MVRPIRRTPSYRSIRSLVRKTGSRFALLLSVSLISTLTVEGQDKRIADSLEIIYDQGLAQGHEALELLRQLAFHRSDHDLRIRYANELIALAIERNDYLYLFRGYLQRGQALRASGEYTSALEAYIKGSEATDHLDDKSFKGGSYLAIADLYSTMGSADNARQAYARSIEILRQTRDTLTLASALINAGDEALKRDEYNQALLYFRESGTLFDQLGYPTGRAYNLGNMGMVYAKQGHLDLAELHIQQAFEILERQEDYSSISEYLTYMSAIYAERGDVKAALSYAQRSLDLAHLHDLKEQISDANLTLSKLYQQAGNHAVALDHFKYHIAYRDSIINLENVQQIADMRTDFEVAQKQVEVDLLNEKRRNQRIVLLATTGALLLVALLSILLYRRYVFAKKTKKIIELERDRSDLLLKNILPDNIATELKKNGQVVAKRHDFVTVLFTDFKGFTRYAENLSPEEVVHTVHYYFSKFDAIAEKYNLEKIKTIGDAYMCAAGLANDEGHAPRMVGAALEIAAFVSETKKDLKSGDLGFDVRIGMHSGPVVAGVVGTRKFAYDIWGDTVNVAARMESASEAGRINISESTYELVKDTWNCVYRGELEVKNRGKLKMYYVDV